MLCTNTMRRVAGQLSSSVSIPLLNIADATAGEIKARGIRKVGLLATQFTMEGDFYKGSLADEHALEVLVPDEGDRRLVHDVIYDELPGRGQGGLQAGVSTRDLRPGGAGGGGSYPRMHRDHDAGG